MSILVQFKQLHDYMQNYFEKIMIKIAIQNRSFTNLVGKEPHRLT